MAKHAKKKKKTSSRRRRMSGLGMSLSATSPIVKWGSIGLGFLFGDKINDQIDKVIDPGKIDQKIEGLGQFGLGTAYIFIMKGKKNVILTAVSGIVAGAGVKRSMKAFGMGGYQNVPSVNGYQNVPSVNGKGRVRMLGANNPGNGGMGMNAMKVAISSNGMMRDTSLMQ